MAAHSLQWSEKRARYRVNFEQHIVRKVTRLLQNRGVAAIVVAYVHTAAPDALLDIPLHLRVYGDHLWRQSER